MQPIRHRDRATHGLTEMQLRHPRWWHPTDGVALPREAADSLVDRCAAIRLALPATAVFTHVTSAQLRGWWLPTGMRTWPHIACTDGDAPHHNDCTLESLRQAIIPGRRGVKRLRRALPLADHRSESAWETILRLLHVLSGITDVEPQAKLRDRTGTIVARADLRLGTTQRLSEYDGAVHRDAPQHRCDLRREKLLLRLGFERYGYTAAEIHQEAHRILRDAEHALGLQHDPTRIRAWLTEYRQSTLSAQGRNRLTTRMRRFMRTTPPRTQKR